MPGVKPLGDMIVVVPIRDPREQSVTEGGIHLDVRMSPGGIALADEVDNEPCEGTVVALGDGFVEGRCPTCEPDGRRHEFEVKIGDRVLWTPWLATTVTLEGVEYNLISERDVLGVFS